MTDHKEKIRSLFYSDQESNRKLAFELAKSSHCYEEMLTEFHTALQELPPFGNAAEWLMVMQEIYEEENLAWPEDTWLLKQLHLEGFCLVYFQEILTLKGSMALDGSGRLVEFPKVLLQLDFVRILDLSWNDLQVLPADIQQMNNLVKLDVSCNNKLRNLPESLANMPQLEELILYGIGGIFEATHYAEDDPRRAEKSHLLPDFFRKMKQLKVLDLGDVYLKELPEWLPEMKQLQALFLFSGSGSNPYLKLPNSFTQLSNLQLLQINAYTTAIPTDIDQLQTLEMLIVEPASHIPSSIKNLKNLTYLDLSYCSYDLVLNQVEGYTSLTDLEEKGLPQGLSRIDIYGWGWLKEMTQLEKFVFKHIQPYAFTELERRELEQALPQCAFEFEA